MSETTEKSQVDNIDTKQPDDSTWNVIITYVRKELSECLDSLELKPHPNRILETSNRLKYFPTRWTNSRLFTVSFQSFRNLFQKNRTFLMFTWVKITPV